jgi:hypothetical protein
MALPSDLGIRYGWINICHKSLRATCGELPLSTRCNNMWAFDQKLQCTSLEPVLQYEMVSTYWHCIVYQKCKHILFRTLESVVGQCAFYGVPKSRFEAFNNRFWISYPLEVRKRLRTAENGLKSNSVTDHHRVHKRCSMIWQHHIKRILAWLRISRLDEGSNPSRSTNLIWVSGPIWIWQR